MIDRVELVSVVTVVYCVEIDTELEGRICRQAHGNGRGSLSVRTKQGDKVWRGYLVEGIDKPEIRNKGNLSIIFATGEGSATSFGYRINGGNGRKFETAKSSKLGAVD